MFEFYLLIANILDEASILSCRDFSPPAAEHFQRNIKPLELKTAAMKKQPLSHIKKDLSNSKNNPNGRAPKNLEESYLLAFRKITF